MKEPGMRGFVVQHEIDYGFSAFLDAERCLIPSHIGLHPARMHGIDPDPIMFEDPCQMNGKGVYGGLGSVVGKRCARSTGRKK